MARFFLLFAQRSRLVNTRPMPGTATTRASEVTRMTRFPLLITATEQTLARLFDTVWTEETIRRIALLFGIFRQTLFMECIGASFAFSQRHQPSPLFQTDGAIDAMGIFHGCIFLF
jgi:hypothetical protein